MNFFTDNVEKTYEQYRSKGVGFANSDPVPPFNRNDEFIKVIMSFAARFKQCLVANFLIDQYSPIQIFFLMK